MSEHLPTSRSAAPDLVPGPGISSAFQPEHPIREDRYLLQPAACEPLQTASADSRFPLSDILTADDLEALSPHGCGRLSPSDRVVSTERRQPVPAAASAQLYPAPHTLISPGYEIPPQQSSIRCSAPVRSQSAAEYDRPPPPPAAPSASAETLLDLPPPPSGLQWSSAETLLDPPPPPSGLQWSSAETLLDPPPPPPGLEWSSAETLLDPPPPPSRLQWSAAETLLDLPPPPPGLEWSSVEALLDPRPPPTATRRSSETGLPPEPRPSSAVELPSGPWPSLDTGLPPGPRRLSEIGLPPGTRRLSETELPPGAPPSSEIGLPPGPRPSSTAALPAPPQPELPAPPLTASLQQTVLRQIQLDNDIAALQTSSCQLRAQLGALRAELSALRDTLADRDARIVQLEVYVEDLVGRGERSSGGARSESAPWSSWFSSGSGARSACKFY